MMVDDHHVEPEPAGLPERIEAGRAAVDRDQQRHALLGKYLYSVGVWTVSFKDTVRNVDNRIEAAGAQIPGKERGRGSAIHVVIAEDCGRLSTLHRIG
jgi:hypothetical protein